MNSALNIRTFIFSALALSAAGVCAKYEFLGENWALAFSGSYRPEAFYGKNLASFNNNNPADQIFFARSTADAALEGVYGPATYQDPVIKMRGSIRNKAGWGMSENILKTVRSPVKINEAVLGSHDHGIPRHLFWMREAWMEFDMGAAFNLPFENRQIFKLGAFPYQLGRGIALGDAYAVSTGVGFWDISNVVDQYAYGALWSSELVYDCLTAEMYVALLQNNSGSLSDTNAKILGQEYGKLKTPKRGFGKINFVVTGKLLWSVFNDIDLGRLDVEPYALFNRDPEQQVEFPSDASSKLGTIGFAAEYVVQDFEAGFDWAVNLGKQQVKGWDRNQILVQNRGGSLVVINDHVIAGDPTDALNPAQFLLYTAAGADQAVVNNSLRAQDQNSQAIGVTALDGTTIFNASNRFRDPYNNIFKGWMGVADAAYWFCDRTLRIAGMVGIASGDDNPNFESKDGDYAGFIPLQEVYTGGRVQSTFLLGGAGRVQRPFTVLSDAQAPDAFQDAVVDVSGFTNIMLVGGSAWWAPDGYEKPFSINPNILAFWQEQATGRARAFLGVEANMFTTINLFPNTSLFCVGSVFIPGGHYTDRKDTPSLTIQQDVIADQLDTTGYQADTIPGLSDNVSFTFNCGLRVTF